MTVLIWIGIILCVSQSGTFSGLNLACFRISKLTLHIEATKGNKNASKILKLRDDSNLLLSTILWGNVAVNVLLALLSNSILTGILAFIFSTFIITFFGEIIPQAYFSKHAFKVSSFLLPVIKFYQILLFPIAKSTSLFLDKWVGPEAIEYMKENDLIEMIKVHSSTASTEIENVEGKGALNFLTKDELPINSIGTELVPKSIVKMEFKNNLPQFPDIEKGSINHSFIKKIAESDKKWVVIIDQYSVPRFILNTDRFIKKLLTDYENFNPYEYCHYPIIISDERTLLRDIISRVSLYPSRYNGMLKDDIVLYWGKKQRIITLHDIVQHLLYGIGKN